MTDPNVRAAEQRWAEGLAAWALPQELVDAAPRSPWGFEVSVFGALADAALERPQDSPSDAVARAALPPAGAVLDVGAGAGAAALRLHDVAGSVTAVDASAELLEAFRSRALALGVAHSTVEGRWPDVAGDVPAADVVVCHHVLYNVPDLVEFTLALDARARRAVVIELTAVHPLTWMAPLWRELHGLERPDRPTADDAVGVLRALGLAVEVRRWPRTYGALGESGHGDLDRIARRLCLPADRHDELRAVLERHPPPRRREVVTISWLAG